MKRPPRLAEWLLEKLLPSGERGPVLGDLAERYARRAEDRAGGRLGAALWYWRRAVALPVWLWGSRLGRLDLDALEVRPVLRRLARSPGFTLVAVASLGIGIGANTAVFTALRALLYTPLAVEAPEELAFVYHTRPQGFSVDQFGASWTQDPETGEGVHSNVSYPIFEAVREAAAPAVDVSGFTFARGLAVVVGDRPATSASAMLLSGDGFTTLGLRTALGRPLLPADDAPDAPPVVVVSHAFWLNVLGGDPAAVGRRMRVNGESVEVVGVLEPGFQGLSPGGFVPPTPLTMPLSAQPYLVPRWTPPEGSLFQNRHRYWLRLVARAPDGAPVEAAREAMTGALRQAFLDESRIAPDQQATVHARLLDGSRGLDGLRRGAERPLKILAGVVALVLLLACANVAGLLLARGAARRRELAVRRAIGAPRVQLGWPLFLESLVVALLGGAAGVGLAWWGGDLVTRALTAGMGAVAVEVELDAGLLALTAGVAVVAALASGLIPALRAADTDPEAHLGVRGVGGETSRLARALIVVQIAVSVPLVVGAGLLTGTVGNLGSVDPGFEPEGLTVFAVDATAVTDGTAEARSLLREVRRNVEAHPGVSGVTFVENVLLSGWMSNLNVEVDGEEVNMRANAVGPDGLEVLGIPVLRGRGIEEGDDGGSPRVAVVNERAAEEVFGGRALGRSFRIGEEEVRVVGVVGDARYTSLREEVRPTFYDAMAQRGRGGAHVVVRSTLGTAALESAIREAVARAHPGLPVTGLRTQTGQIRATIARETVFARLLTLFGGFALLLACIGLHGITSFSVTRRAREMGIRLALGARPRGVLRMVMRQVVALALLGLVLGLGGAYLATPVLESLLFGVEPTEPGVFVVAGTALVAVAVLAGWLPARRAARTDPLEVLGAE